MIDTTNIEKYLQYIRDIDIDIKMAKDELDYFKSINYSSASERRILELENDIAQKTVDKCGFAIMCEKLPNKLHRTIMKRYYILRQSYREIAKSVYMCDRSIRNHHDTAVIELAAIIANNK